MATTPSKITGRTKLALWLLIAPTALFVATFLLFAIANWILNPTMWPTADGEAFAPTPIGVTIANIVLFLTGTISVITWLPGLITGIVLLATAPPKK